MSPLQNSPGNVRSLNPLRRPRCDTLPNTTFESYQESLRTTYSPNRKPSNPHQRSRRMARSNTTPSISTLDTTTSKIDQIPERQRLEQFPPRLLIRRMDTLPQVNCPPHWTYEGRTRCLFHQINTYHVARTNNILDHVSGDETCHLKQPRRRNSQII